MATIKQLLKQAESDKYAIYSDEWQAEAVAILNEKYFDDGRYDDEIFDTNSDVWDELVKQQLESRGWVGLMFFLGQIRTTTNLAQLDGYGNATEITGDDLLGFLKDESEVENGD